MTVRHPDDQGPQPRTCAAFGDFWDQATRLALPPAYRDRSAGIQQIRHTMIALSRVVSVMRRYLADIEGNMGEAARSGLWAGAIDDSRAALDRAIHVLGLVPSGDGSPPFPPGSLAARLDGYATAVIYARDLLHTHFTTSPDGRREAFSDWAPAIASVPVSRALLAGLADHARAVAVQIAALPLSPSATAETESEWRHILAAGHNLRAVDAAVQAAQWQAPVLPEHRRLLESIPVNSLPRPYMPGATETISSLCAGTIDAAQRVGRAQRDLTARAAWAPELTADSMRHTAANCVVTSLNTEIVFQVLAMRARELGYHALMPELTAAAERAAGARHTWLAAARSWDQMVTDTRGYLSQPALEAENLARWTGRLVYADPDWTPTRKPSASVRDPAALAADPAEFTNVIAAMHHAADSLSRFAVGGLDSVLMAASAGRLYVTTRSLPQGKYDVPRRFADAPHNRVTAVISVYSQSAAANHDALQSAGRIADAVGAPSRVLTAMENALADPIGVVPRGRLEQGLFDLGVRDSQMLRRAACLDEIAQGLVADARHDQLGLGHTERRQDLAEVMSLFRAASPAIAAAEPAGQAAEPVLDPVAGQYVPRAAAPEQDNGAAPRPQTKYEARLEDFTELRKQGLTTEQTADRLDVDIRSAFRYKAALEPEP
jgi:hypothetical protein